MVSFYSWLWTIPVDTIATGISKLPNHISSGCQTWFVWPRMSGKTVHYDPICWWYFDCLNRSWGTSNWIGHHCWTICIKKDTNAAFTKLKLLKSKSHFWVKQLVQEIDPLHRSRAASVKAIPPPNTIKTLRSFLGTTGYCRPWIEDYASIAQPLYDLLKGNGKDSDTVCMEELHLKAFNDWREHYVKHQH